MYGTLDDSRPLIDPNLLQSVSMATRTDTRLKVVCADLRLKFFFPPPPPPPQSVAHSFSVVVFASRRLHSLISPLSAFVPFGSAFQKPPPDRVRMEPPCQGLSWPFHFPEPRTRATRNGCSPSSQMLCLCDSIRVLYGAYF